MDSIQQNWECNHGQFCVEATPRGVNNRTVPGAPEMRPSLLERGGLPLRPGWPPRTPPPVAPSGSSGGNPSPAQFLLKNFKGCLAGAARQAEGSCRGAVGASHGPRRGPPQACPGGGGLV